MNLVVGTYRQIYTYTYTYTYTYVSLLCVYIVLYDLSGNNT